MRAGGCTVQQALTTEAASVVKQAVNLARRRGHAQVTPLHVANTMLSSSTGLLRTACLQSHSHPLQCKALELCFNVALNRLPTSTSSPMLGHHSHHPSLSNALVAAFKRAQAQQRRGSIENQQQPLLAVKVEIEQLIISILDDPSVSRVMREAGFSSTQVKSNVEQAISLEICSQSSPVSSKSKESNLLTLGNTISQSPPLGQFGVKTSKPRSLDQVRNEDVTSVIETLMNRRSTVVVGECLVSTEGVVRGVMDKVDRRDVPEALRDVQFISLPLFSFGHLHKEEVEQKMGELRCLVNSPVGRGAVLYLGDLKWAAEFRASSGDQDSRNYYCPVEHMIMELGRLVTGFGDSGRFWLIGIATFHTYMRCRIGNPSLETVWSLHPLTIPAGSLGLSLSPDSNSQVKFRTKNNGDASGWPLLESGVDKQLTCCADCSVKFENEARSLVTSSHDTTPSFSTSSLPSWLQQYKAHNETRLNRDQDPLQVRDLCKKWNSICTVAHHHSTDKALNFSSISPSSSTSISSYDQHYPELHQSHQSWPITVEPKQPWRKQHFWIAEDSADEEPNLRMYIPEYRVPKPVLLPNSNPTSTCNSASSGEAMEMEYFKKYKELNAENLKSLCNALEQKVPWQKDIIPDIASTILQCRSGMIRRKEKLKQSESKEETWFFFQGIDVDGKEKIARELASLVFGSQTSYLSIGLSSFSSPKADSMEDLRNKRVRDESSCSYLERLAEAIRSNPHRVFLVEDIEQVDYCSQLGFKRAIERGTIMNSNGDEVCLSDSIIILSCESFSSRSRACSPSAKLKLDESNEEERCDEDASPCASLDLNLSAEEDFVDDQSIDDIGLLESVDRQIIFNLQDL
ncbi:Smax1-like [Thalictrum thalictroides]|uniref:Smax1-like n=1 Tax=Thalictrum thalictroides TaxID=46969 RepID=A0A7J6V4G5_THATH|nr:Smax1-like [Thalictrum thalictroides]